MGFQLEQMTQAEKQWAMGLEVLPEQGRVIAAVSGLEKLASP